MGIGFHARATAHVTRFLEHALASQTNPQDFGVDHLVPVANQATNHQLAPYNARPTLTAPALVTAAVKMGFVSATLVTAEKTVPMDFVKENVLRLDFTA